jgi:hypothetical protein
MSPSIMLETLILRISLRIYTIQEIVMKVNKEFLIQQIGVNNKNETFVSENKKVNIEVDYNLHPLAEICEDYALLKSGHSNQISNSDWNEWCNANNALHLIV